MTRVEPSVSGEGLGIGISAEILQHMILLLRIMRTACKLPFWQTNTVTVVFPGVASCNIIVIIID